MSIAQFESMKIDNHHQKPRSFDVLQEFVAHSNVLMRSLDQTGQISHWYLPVIIVFYYADLWTNGCNCNENYLEMFQQWNEKSSTHMDRRRSLVLHLK